jgi:glucuronate isomerase
MRTNGIAERFCTGDATDREKFDAFAGIVPYLLRNPLYHWCHLELARYFQIDDLLLSAETADAVWERSLAVFQSGISARSLIETSNVLAVCTTDDPIDSLEHHAAAAADETFNARVFPTWRPDRALALADPTSWNSYVDQLAATADVEIASYDDLIVALTARHDFFHRAGCRISDHALATCLFSPTGEREVRTLFDRARSGAMLSPTECDQLTTALLLELGRMNSEQGWTMQLHIGALRNNNSAMHAELGSDCGFDSIGDRRYAEPLAGFLDALDTAGTLPRIILYNIHPQDNEMLATMLGNFQDGSVPGKLQLGSAWWFLDRRTGWNASWRPSPKWALCAALWAWWPTAVRSCRSPVTSTSVAFSATCWAGTWSRDCCPGTSTWSVRWWRTSVSGMRQAFSGSSCHSDARKDAYRELSVSTGG